MPCVATHRCGSLGLVFASFLSCLGTARCIATDRSHAGHMFLLGVRIEDRVDPLGVNKASVLGESSARTSYASDGKGLIPFTRALD